MIDGDYMKDEVVLTVRDITYICTRDTPECKTGEIVIIFPTFVCLKDVIYKYVTNTGYLLDDEYLMDHFKLLQVRD